MSDTLRKLRQQSAVKNIDEENGNIRLYAHGNCRAFNIMFSGEDVFIGNVSTFPNGDLKVNFK